MLKEILSFILSVLPNWLAVLLMAVDLCGRKKNKRVDEVQEKWKGPAATDPNSQVLATPATVNATGLRWYILILYHARCIRARVILRQSLEPVLR